MPEQVSHFPRHAEEGNTDQTLNEDDYLMVGAMVGGDKVSRSTALKICRALPLGSVLSSFIVSFHGRREKSRGAIANQLVEIRNGLGRPFLSLSEEEVIRFLQVYHTLGLASWLSLTQEVPVGHHSNVQSCFGTDQDLHRLSIQTHLHSLKNRQVV